MPSNPPRSKAAPKKSMLWIAIIIIVFFVTGLLPVIIAVDLEKFRSKKAYDDFQDGNYIKSIIWTAVIWPLSWAIDYFIGNTFGLIILLVATIVSWLATKDIGKK